MLPVINQDKYLEILISDVMNKNVLPNALAESAVTCQTGTMEYLKNK